MSVSAKMIRTGLSLVLATGVMSTMSGCTDNEVVASALVIGAAAIVVSDDTPAPHRHYPHRPVPRYEPRRGHGYPPRYDDHRGPHRHDLTGAVSSPALVAAAIEAKSTSETDSKFKSTDERVVSLAANYDINHYAATYLVRAIVLAQTKDTTGIEALGLSVGDFKDMYQGRELEASKIETLGSALKLNTEATAQLLSDLTVDVQAKKAAKGL